MLSSETETLVAPSCSQTHDLDVSHLPYPLTDKLASNERA